MSIQKLYKFWLTTSLASTSFYCLVGTGLAQAQSITPDATLPTPTEVTPTEDGVEITGGTARDINLFHSFQKFSLLNGNEAFFNNASTISNIITRVTGGNISTIDGLIRANNANLFFLNPDGILFGPNASLNIGGSFYGSTADSLIFPEGEFSATNPQAPPVLTINAPIGLGFRDNPGDITVNGSVLSVDVEKTLALIGGNVTGDFGYLIARGGRIELGGLTATGTVSFNDDGSLSFPDAVPRGDVSLIDQTWLEVDGEQGGSIGINANNLEILENSKLQGGTFADGLADSQSGDIILNATGDITVNSSRIDNAVEIGNAGKIEITGQSFSLNNGGVLTNSTFGKGNAGNITLNIDGAVNITNGTIFSNVEAGGVGDGGIVTIDSGSLFLTNGGIYSQVAGSGQGGEVTVNTDSLTLSQGSIISTSTLNQAVENERSNAGNIKINISNFLKATDGSFLASVTFGEGDAGNITINGEGASLSFDGTANNLPSGIFTQGFVGNGKAGEIQITADSLSLSNSAQINSTTSGQGKAGNITVDVENEIILSNNGNIFSEVGSNAIVPEEEVGTITINAGSFSIADGTSSISTSTLGQGDAGNVILNIDGAVNITNGTIFSNVEAGGVGNGGTVTINSGSLSLQNGGQIQALVRGEDTQEQLPGGVGNAGNIIIDVDDSVNITGISERTGLTSAIFSFLGTGATGSAGNIKITAGSLALDDGGFLQNSTFGEGKAGDITLDVDGNVTLSNNGDIVSEVGSNAIVPKGEASTITINADSFSIVDRESSISTTTFGTGDAGNITLNISNNVSLNDGNIFSQVGDGGKGNGGNIEVNTTNLSLLNGSQLTAGVFGTGNAGKVIINATDTVSFQGVGSDGLPSGVLNNVAAKGVGNAGDIDITTKNLNLNDNARISSNLVGIGNAGEIKIVTTDLNLTDSGTISVNAFGQGNGGKIDISAQNINIDGTFSKISSDVNTEENFTGGEINISTNNLMLTNGGTITASTFGQGNGGKITVTASDTIAIDGKGDDGFASGIGSEVSQIAVGNAGDTEINTNNLIISNGGVVSTSTFGIGNAGTIKINANDISIYGKADDGSVSGIGSRVAANAQGNAGGIEIRTDELSIDNGGQISVNSQGEGQGGSLFIQADNLSLDNESSLLASTPLGTGGNIALEIAEVLSLRGNSLISAEAKGDANGGNVNINAQFVVAFPDDGVGNDIVASAAQGKGGQVTINAQQIFNLKERKADSGNGTNDIDVSSEAGLDGRVNLTIFKDDILRNASELPRNPVEANQTVAQACSSQGIAEGGNSFTVTGKGGVPPQPTEPMSSDAILLRGTIEPEEAEVQGSRGAGESLSTDSSHNQNQQQPQGILTSQGYIIPAQGIIKKENGEVMLVGYPVNNINQRTPVQSPNCGKS
ncbi:MAG: hypothetical protein Kow0049_35710 [Stanieria sp.]